MTAVPRPKVGLVLAFTGHYPSVRVIGRFLEHAGIDVVKSRVTTPQVIEAGTALASAEFCIPLRTFVGHVYHLVNKHPDLDAVVAPNVLSEDGISSTCSKYRDLGGVAIRSLGDSVGYLLSRVESTDLRRQLRGLVGADALRQRLERSKRVPTFLMPNVRTLARVDMRNVCYDVYADVVGWPRAKKAAWFLSPGLRKRFLPRMAELEEAFARAYDEVVGKQASPVESLLADETKPRLALVGRRYLVHDPALSCDLKPWFERKGAAVITAADLPAELLREAYVDADGYYDTHKEGQAFIDWAAGKVDGVISIGSFGCHPDAFQTDYLAEHARAKALPTWTFRYDESAGSAGFHTRYETIFAFLEQRRNERLRGAAPAAGLTVPAGVTAEPAAEPAGSAQEPAADRLRKPLIIWPYMGEVLDLLVDEACYQLGLSEYMFPPVPLSEKAIELGNDRYTESCSPYACSTGTLKQSLSRALKELGTAGDPGQPAEPRRIIMLMARGEGPCTFGWYAIVQNKHLPEEFRQELQRGGHTLEMATMGLDGVVDFIRDLCRLGNRERLKPILDYVEAWEQGLGRLPWHRRTKLKLGLFGAINDLTRTAWAKLDAAEDLRARTLVRRAHELEQGSVTASYRQALALLRQAHTVGDIEGAHRRGVELLEAVPGDDRIKPRVVAIGEIYVALTSFGNRGTIENLLGREGIEVVEGVTLGGFIRNSLKEMKRRSRRNQRWLRPILEYLRQRNIYLMEQEIRDPEARPFLVHEVGGDGLPSVAHARHHVEEGCDGIIHIYPFKCMPEGIAKDAVKELADLYGVRYLSLSFDKEIEVERLKTEVSTFATLLHAQIAQHGADDPAIYWQRKRDEMARRKAIGRTVTELYDAYRDGRHVD